MTQALPNLEPKSATIRNEFAIIIETKETKVLITSWL